MEGSQKKKEREGLSRKETGPLQQRDTPVWRETEGQRGTEGVMEERKCEADRQGTAT